MIPSVLLYLFSGALVPTIGFAGVFVIITYWVIVVGRHSVVEGRLVLPSYLWSLVALFALVVTLGMLTWQRPFDLRDPLALVLFFCAVPALICAQSLRAEEWLTAARRTALVAFVVASVVIVIWALSAGVNWQRSYFLVPTMHKNAVGATYEVLLLAAVLDQPRGRRRWILAGVGLVCLGLVGSKTALALTAAVVAVILLGWWGVALVTVGGTAATAFAIANLDLESPLRNLVLRIVLWAQAWDEISASPTRLWLGVGPGTFAAAVNLPGLVGLRSTHNLVLQFWHSYGLLGLLVVMGFFVWLLRRFGVRASPFLAGFWLFNLHALFDVGWVKGAGFVASAALGLGMAEIAQRTQTRRSAPV